jgi:hypothetical protein
VTNDAPSRRPRAAEPDVDGAIIGGRGDAARGKQEIRGVAAPAAPDHAKPGFRYVHTIGARVDVRAHIVIQVPLEHIARQIKLAPETDAERRGSHGRDVRETGAGSGSASVIAAVNGVLTRGPRRCIAPRIFELLAPRRGRVFVMFI